MPLINCEIDIILIWPTDCINFATNGATEFTITDANLYIPVVILSAEYSKTSLQQSKSGFECTINFNKY